ncbi:hypothetical protein HG535_0C06290 [Zygotorulaspora mrakii]|uniref:Uncharacterized protein n=1 Tax=Zygotorulaspora mrakii TaxID=42260 RepID=A0A7H9B1K8_ZYGMR|nr:uncharacterized protein HG535_0C06290 [Zygotorulaspora mrakii]QLG72274.1 hypothetical protein HG535_0C06290 [Zygotorulaspora mrakii]
MANLKYTAEVADLLKFDKEHLWHPYTSMCNPLPVYPVASANGCVITLDTDSEEKYDLIEAMSSWWCMIHGYNNEELNAAIIDQTLKMSHVMFGGLTHKPAICLGQNILRILDQPQLQKVFFADSGSVAVEVAMKMALQYEFTVSNGSSRKNKFITIKNGYHGDTFGAMSVCDPVNSMHTLYKGYLAENIFVNAPTMLTTLPTSRICLMHPEVFSEATKWHQEDFEEFLKTVEEKHDQLCAVILEPLLQGAGGMRFYHPQFLIEVRKVCNFYKIPLIMDEIATGFGRTGAMFAFKHCGNYQNLLQIPPKEQVDVFPDILCLGKALTGGYMTLSAVVTTLEICNGISSPKSATRGSFMHGPTFMGNPLACSVANKSLEILLRGQWKDQVERIEAHLFEGLYLAITTDTNLMKYAVNSVRVCGAVGVVELKEEIDVEWFQKQFLSRKVYIRPFSKLCYIMPPYVISEGELEKVTRAIREVLFVYMRQKMNRNHD